MGACVEQGALLRDGLVLDGTEIGERIVARVVVIAVAAGVDAEVEDAFGRQCVGVSGRQVEGKDLRALIGVADGGEDRGCGCPGPDDVLDGEVVVGVGSEEPGAAEVDVEADGVDRRELAVDAVEEVELVPLVVEDGELGRVEKATGVEAVDLDEVAPLLAAIGEVDGAGGGPEGSVGGSNRAGGDVRALAGAGRHLDDERGLAAVFGRRSAVDDLDGLYGVRGNLVGEDLGLLVGDVLTVDIEGVGGVVAHAMEEAVRIRGDAGRGEGDERAQAGGGAFEREFLEGRAVDIGVEGGVRLGGRSGGDVHDGGGSADGELGVDGERHEGADLDGLAEGVKTRGRGAEVIRIERQVTELEVPGVVGPGGSVEAADGVCDGDAGVGDDGAGAVGDHA